MYKLHVGLLWNFMVIDFSLVIGLFVHTMECMFSMKWRFQLLKIETNKEFNFLEDLQMYWVAVLLR